MDTMGFRGILTAQLRRLPRGSIKARMTVGVAAVMVLTMGLCVLDEVREDREFLMREETSQALRLAHNFAAASAALVRARQYPVLEELARSFRLHTELDHLMFVSRDGKVLAHSDSDKLGQTLRDATGVDMLAGPPQVRILRRGDDRIEVAVPVLVAGRLVGWSRVGFSLVHVREGEAEALQRGILFLAIGVAAAIVAALWSGGRLTARLRRLLGTMDRIRVGDRSVRAEIRGDDEIDRLALGFNSMVDTLTESERRAEQDELRLRLASRAGGVGLFEFDSGSGRLYLPAEWLATLGYAEGDLNGSVDDWESLAHPIDRPGLAALRRNLRAGEPTRSQFEFRMRAKNGFYHWIFCHGVRLNATEGGAARVAGVLIDVSERREAELRLRHSEARFRSIAANVPGMVFEFVADGGEGHFSYVSGGARELCGRQPEELVDMSDLLSLLHADDRESFKQMSLEVARTLAAFNWEGRMHVGREVKWVNVRAAVHRQDEAVVWHGVVLNVTESRRAAEALRRSRDEVRELTRHQEAVREEEKAGIAREIHDELGATLTALKMDAHWLERRVAALAPEHAAKLKEMQALVDQAVQSTRRISTELRPRVIDDLGIIAALEWLVGEFRRQRGVDCRFAAMPEHIDLDTPRAITLFRIVQESLTNVAKHSGASRVSVDVREQDEGIVLRIEDNGCGIQDRAIDGEGKPFSHGLRGMFERAHQIGGSLSLGRGPQGGTVVAVTIPGAAAAADARSQASTARVPLPGARAH
jgi:PAS domain S-box-containing protein